MLDTVALYVFKNNRLLLAKYVGHRHSEYTLASKCVLDVYDGERGLNGNPNAIAGTLDLTLKRLDTDHIDLYYLHRLDKNLPIEESIGALVLPKRPEKLAISGCPKCRLRRPGSRMPFIRLRWSSVNIVPVFATLKSCGQPLIRKTTSHHSFEGAHSFLGGAMLGKY
ncbi:aldo/keto reductase [Parasphingorhabdus sp.]|uniref:aldo/keto reductase n=1 Tax=Parasphingorhabdus sp. TaxID=2709688 RepID=UPI003BAF0F35